MNAAAAGIGGVACGFDFYARKQSRRLQRLRVRLASGSSAKVLSANEQVIGRVPVDIFLWEEILRACILYVCTMYVPCGLPPRRGKLSVKTAGRNIGRKQYFSLN